MIEELVHTDAGRAVRQCAVMDNRGRAAQWTGSQTPRWSGDLRGDQVATQGNRLYGEHTLAAALEAFEQHADVDLEFHEKLMPVIRQLPTRADPTGAATREALSGDQPSS